jgi:hypothetical protein
MQKAPIQDLASQAKAFMKEIVAENVIPLAAWRKVAKIKDKYEEMMFAHADVHAAMNQGVNLADEDLLTAGMSCICNTCTSFCKSKN